MEKSLLEKFRTAPNLPVRENKIVVNIAELGWGEDDEDENEITSRGELENEAGFAQYFEETMK